MEKTHRSSLPEVSKGHVLESPTDSCSCKRWDPRPALRDKKLRQCPVYAIQGVGWTLHAHPTLVGSGHASSSFVKHADFLLGLDLEQRQLLESLVRGLFPDSYRKKNFID